MTDSLRDRIAAAIRGVDDMRACKLSNADIKFMADAVIKTLGLQPEWSVGDDEAGRVLWLAHETPYENRRNEPVQIRYITDWEYTDD